MTVTQIKKDMPYDELQGWFVYLSMHPIGWREDDRTYKLLLAQGCKGKPWDFFSSAAIMHDNEREQREASSKVSFFNALNSRAVGGDKIES